jgi:hypothetical protein
MVSSPLAKEELNLDEMWNILKGAEIISDTMLRL